MPRPTDREIKFRYVWLHRETGRFTTPILTMRQIEAGEVAEQFDYEWRKYRQLIARDQFTGLTDRNGVEVYENDWVECDMSYKGGFLPHAGLVVWHEGVPGFATENDAGATLFHHHLARSIKVIGSIHEHPDLLTQESNES